MYQLQSDNKIYRYTQNLFPIMVIIEKEECITSKLRQHLVSNETIQRSAMRNEGRERSGFCNEMNVKANAN